jgi:hypothetical protein
VLRFPQQSIRFFPSFLHDLSEVKKHTTELLISGLNQQDRYRSIHTPACNVFCSITLCTALLSENYKGLAGRCLSFEPLVSVHFALNRSTNIGCKNLVKLPWILILHPAYSSVYPILTSPKDGTNTLFFNHISIVFQSHLH